MNPLDRLDAEPSPLLTLLADQFDLSDIQLARQRLRDLFSADSGFGPRAGVAVVALCLRRDDGEIQLRVYPKESSGATARPVLYWMHGGGMVMGDVTMGDAWCSALADELDLVVVSVG